MTNRAPLPLAFALACMCSGAAAAQPECAASVEGLHSLAGASPFPLRWEETSMSDGKPLVVSIHERDGLLFMEFLKTREGLWAESEAVICKTGAALEARFGHLRAGPAAPWLLRGAFGQTRAVAMSLAGGRLRIALPGWSGTFLAKQD